jgi:hypothetical protein
MVCIFVRSFAKDNPQPHSYRIIQQSMLEPNLPCQGFLLISYHKLRLSDCCRSLARIMYLSPATVYHGSIPTSYLYVRFSSWAPFDIHEARSSLHIHRHHGNSLVRGTISTHRRYQAGDIWKILPHSLSQLLYRHRNQTRHNRIWWSECPVKSLLACWLHLPVPLAIPCPKDSVCIPAAWSHLCVPFCCW